MAYDDDHGHVAMPKLVGGPKYMRPPVPALNRVERPPDPDDLPLASERTPEDHVLAQELGLEGSLASAAESAFGAGPAVPPPPVPEIGGRGAHPGGPWSISGGMMGSESRPRHRGFGLFRGRGGRSGIG